MKKNYITSIKNITNIAHWMPIIHKWRPYMSHVVFLCIFYCIALAPLFLANVNFLDDSHRALTGGRGWAYLHSRWISEYASIFVHADTILRDISPFPQLIAIVLIALSSVAICIVVCGKKYTKTALVISALLGVTPFFLECFAFKFDAPYMALSVLASVIPFLFAHKTPKIFISASFIGTLVMLTTYQLASGMYIMMTLFFVFHMWNSGTWHYRKVGQYIILALVGYGSALIFFRIFLMQKGILEHHTIFSFTELLPGVIANTQDHFHDIFGALHVVWIGILCVMIALFIVKAIVVSTHDKVLASILIVGMLVVMFIFVQGFFVFVDGMNSVPRYYIGMNMFIVLIALYLIKPPHAFFGVPGIALVYCFFVFAFAFGNALTDQVRFKTFIATMLMHDLSKIVTTTEQLENTHIYLREPIGNAPSVESLQKDYPIAKKLIPNDFGRHVFGYTNLAWYNFPAMRPEKMTKDQKDQSKKAPIMAETFYYTIRGDKQNLYIWFNNR